MRLSQLIEHVRDTPKLQFSQGNVHDLIRRSRAVVTVNSGVGAEALLHRKAVILTTALDHLAAGIPVRTEEELYNQIGRAEIPIPDVDLEAFILEYCRNYMVRLGDMSALKAHDSIAKLVRGNSRHSGSKIDEALTNERTTR